MTIAHHVTISTPIGPLLLAVSDAGLCAVSWLDPHPLAMTLHHLRERGFEPIADDSAPEVMRWQRQVVAYFAGTLREFEDDLDFSGASVFTERALRGILDIPWGSVRTYGEVAASIGMPGGTQAIGNAMGRNPLPVVVPCHRVIRANGEMGHYTGGAQIKEALLATEGIRFKKHPGQLSLF
jgi:methylated-DNA-[protein]-cysteine S-methyltransferase